MAGVEDPLPDPKLRAWVVGPSLLAEGQGPACEGDLDSPTNPGRVSGFAEEVLGPTSDQAHQTPGWLSREDVVEGCAGRVVTEAVEDHR